MRTTIMLALGVTLAACMPTEVGDDNSCNNDQYMTVMHDIFVSSQDDVDALPRTCFTVPMNTVTVRASQLTDLQALKNLKETRRLIIESNSQLESTEGLNANVTAEIIIEDNDTLFEFSGTEATQVLDRVSIANNPRLTHISGLANLKIIKGELNISGPSNIETLDRFDILEGLGSLKVMNTTGIQSVALPLLKQVLTDVIIDGNENMTTLGRFGYLGEVGGHVHIQNNPVLLDTNGFTLKFQKIGGTLMVHNNAVLESVYDLQWVYTVGGSLIITWNPNLSRCRAEDMKNTVVEVGADVDVGDNSPLWEPCEP